MVVSLLIASVLFAVITSAILLASRAVPGADAPVRGVTDAGTVLDQIASELQSAVYIVERSPTAIAFTMPDRNGDGLDERVRYAWSGTAGGPLTRQYNGGAAGVVLDKVTLFNVTPRFDCAAETCPGVGAEDAADSLLVSCDTGADMGNIDVKSDNWPAQHFAFTPTDGAVAWRPTRVRLMIRKKDAPGRTDVQRRTADANLRPAAAVQEFFSVYDTALPASYDWREFAFTGAPRLSPASAICMVLAFQSGTRSATVQSNRGTGLLLSANAGVTWSYSSTVAIRSQLYGKLTRSGPTQYATRKYLTAVRFTIQADRNSPPLQTRVRVLNTPELLSGLWSTEFDSDPTAQDVNGDGVGDWTVRGGGAVAPSSLSGGVWRTTTTVLDTAPGCDFTNTVIADLRLRSTTVGGTGATFTISADRAAGVRAFITAALRLESDGTQTLTVSHNLDDATGEPLIVVQGLSSGFISLRLIIDTAVNSVSVTTDAFHRGTYRYSTFATTSTARCASLLAGGCTAEFASATIRVLEAEP